MSAQPPVKYTEAWLPGFDGLKFYTRTYPALSDSGTPTAPRGAVIFQHGFAEHIQRYEHVHSVWAVRGFTVFAFDLRGYGRTALDVENRSESAGWSKTSWREQLSDIEWWVKRLREEISADVPLFLMGHSMGGALCLAFATRDTEPPSRETVQMLSGVIAASPLIVLSDPPFSPLVWLGGKVSLLWPHMQVPANVRLKCLSRDPEVMSKVIKDPLMPMPQKGSLRQLYDFITGGRKLLVEDHKRWPKDLPIYLYHGTSDGVTKFEATEELFQKLDIPDKKFTSYPGAYHELHNEPKEVSEKVINETIAWAEAHLSPVTAKL